MAKDNNKVKNPNKAPGMFAQLREGVNFLKEENPKALPLAILIGIGVFLFITVLGLFISGATILGTSLWAALGLMTGYLSGLYSITRQANTAVFKKYASEPGRVSLVAGVLTRRSYKGTNQPTAVNPRTKDMVFRVVGPAGVVLLGDGAPTSTKSMLEEERRKIQRVAQGVQVHTIYCSDNGDGVPLMQLEKAVKKLKRSLNRTDIRNVQNRLAALDTRGGLPIPKGIDPMKVRAPKKMR